MINFIQIGANVGNTSQDIIWPIIQQRGWHGIFIEPIPEAFTNLINNYQNCPGCYFENIAIMDYNGTTDIFYNPSDDTQIASTFNTHSPGRNTQKITVPCQTLSSIISKYNMFDPFELLQIDAEGADYKILMCTDFTNIKPKYIRFEHCHFGKLDSEHPDQAKKELRRLDIIHHLARFGYKEVPDIFNNGLEGEVNIDTLLQRII